MSKFDCQLLCTFSTYKTYLKEISTIQSVYSISGERVYILMNVDNPEQIFLTYNVDKNCDRHYPNTISVHRKKESNTLYSINALNELVKFENGGRYSPNYKIDWTKYRNSIIVISDGKLNVISTKLMSVLVVS